MLQLVFLTPEFYEDHARFSEIEQKGTRPYASIKIQVSGVLWAIPLRSNIQHQYAIFTDKSNNCGIDFTKAVVVSEPSRYINRSVKPHIRQNEYSVVKRISEHHLRQQFSRFILSYKDAKLHPTAHHNRLLLKYSTLQYFEHYL